MNATEAIVCRKFDEEKQSWSYVDHLQVPKRDILQLVLLPNGGMVIMLDAPNLYVYDGNELKLVSQNFPFYKESNFTDYECRTPISNDEIVVGMASRKNENYVADSHLYLINLSNGNMTKVGPIDSRARRSKCGAYGPPGNRKVFIFGGITTDTVGQYRSFRGAIIFDRNSGKFTYPGGRTGQTFRHTTPYEDTFLNNNIFISSAILTLQYNNTDAKLQRKGHIRGRYHFMSTISSKYLTCTA
ncbi:hypothetical protein TCAL_08737 [Tigriopus californicus]|uniref:Uncharacterized protein n=1 Tax=Tigriopus californicus TaxID=6832 RepID=A0A553P5M1_TIGCA|nr:uncharacterized protein LOC131878013 [Tigriopus californicus]TRY72984.1 hypothetical protein TCAL_08737 [Tigriopus californicus]|eukprot:TCALIF_08737-PA protein Name:"Protein of unknown function" AED:0.29 eAED:0.29 QI:0/1/0/1/1/1/2/0/242